MINILIVDDDQKKIDQISSIICRYDEIPPRNTQVCKCIVDAKRALKDTHFDLVVLDIQLPAHKGEDPIQTGGMDLLREIHSRSIYIKPTSIIGLTAYKDTIEQASKLFQDRMWNIVHYNPIDTSWSNRLAIKLEYLIESSQAIDKQASYDYDLAIITALTSPEFNSVLKLTDWTDLPVDGDCTRYITGEFRAEDKKLKVVAACAPQMGMPATAVATTKLISHFHPKYVSMVGITAGVKGAVNLGDIVVADPSWDWGSGKLKATNEGSVFSPDPLPERLEPAIKTMLKDASLDQSMIQNVWNSWQGNKPDIQPTVHVGPCASGACVVADESAVDEIKGHSRKLIGIEMEAYGLMHAASHAIGNRPMAFSMKSVCDFADESKSDNMQAFASYMSAELLKRIALKYI